MKPNFHILQKLFTEFIKDSHGLTDYSVKSGDGEKSLSYIATRVFKGDRKLFSEWLRGHHEELGTSTPIKILEKDIDSWVIRDALMKKWLTQERLVVPRPVIELPYKKVVINGFPTFVLEKEDE